MQIESIFYNEVVIKNFELTALGVFLEGNGVFI